MKYSSYQQDFFDTVAAFFNGRVNYKYILLNAVAGSGKTFSLIESLKFIPKNIPIKFFAFNKSIADELQKKAPHYCDVSTLHSFGMRSLRSSLKGIEFNMKDLKAWKYVENYIKDNNFEFDSFAKKNIFVFDICKLFDMWRLNLCELMDGNKEEIINELMMKYDVQMDIRYIKCLQSVAHQIKRYNDGFVVNGKRDKFDIDFVDMIYLVVIYDLPIRQFKLVYVDECQDLSKLQLRFTEKSLMKNGLGVFVGDKHQCQPIGTKIQMSDGSIKNIEDVEIGDSVGSFDKETGQYRWTYNRLSVFENQKQNTPKILEKSVRSYFGKLYTIKSNNKQSQYTDNHKCIYRVINKEDAYIVYLMEKDGYFRIGKSKWYSKSNRIGAKGRFMSEKADKLWILGCFFSENEAYLNEQFLSYKYGIPQFRFVENNLKDQSKMEIFWNMVDKDELFNNGLKLISFFNRNYDYPFYLRSEKSGIRNNKSSIYKMSSINYMNCTQACNLISEIMEVSFYKNDRRNHFWQKIDNVIVENVENLPVYSLKVSKTELYIADGILTHNSIYAFAGADDESFDILKNREGTIQLPLSVCYRCGKSIVEYAQPLVPHILPFEGADEGEVIDEGNVFDADEGDWILCRNLKPLVELWLYFISKEKKCFIKGKDLGKNLLNLISKVENLEIEAALETLDESLFDLEQKLIDAGVKKPKKHKKYAQLEEDLLIIKRISENYITMKSMVAAIEKMFSDKEADETSILMMTMHKSKGLENDVVYIVRMDLLPSKYATQEYQIQQEKNLLYVAITRAKKKLIMDQRFV